MVSTLQSIGRRQDMKELIIEVIGFLLSIAFLCIVIMILMDDIPNLFF